MILTHFAQYARVLLLVATAAGLATALPAQTPTRPPLARPARTPGKLEVPKDALHFLAIGDWGRQGEQPQQAVANVMAVTAKALDAAFVVTLGDNFYPDGVASTRDPLWESSFNNVYRQFALQIPWYIVQGNHDYRGSVQAQLDYTNISRRWRAPARYYSFTQEVDDSTTVEFFVFDTTPLVSQYYTKEPGKHAVVGIDTIAQRRWADSVLSASKAQWKIAFAHHHIYTGAGRETMAETEQFFVPRVARYGVQAYFSGHEHSLQHIVRTGQKTQYFISGGGSERDPEEHKGVAKWYGSDAGFAAISITVREMLVQFLDSKGRVAYTTRIPR